MENEMNITDARYDVDRDGNNVTIIATIDGIEMHIQNPSEGNRHYGEIMRQVDEGTLTIADAE
jgi:hypothetical protein